MHTSLVRKAQKFSVPKNNRGLLTNPKPEKILPGNEPAQYETGNALVLKPRQGSFSIGKASRDVPFSKYGGQHSVLVRKGLF